MNDQELRQALSELPQERAGEDFTARVLERLDSLEAPEPQAAPEWFARPWALPAAAALGTVLVIGLLVALLSAWPGGLFGGADSVASSPAPAPGSSDAVAEDAAPGILNSQGLEVPTPVSEAGTQPELAATAVHSNPREASSGSLQARQLRAQRLLAEQRRLSQELGELRRQMHREPAVVMGGTGGERLLVPLVPGGRRAAAASPDAPARLASFDPNGSSPARGSSNRSVRVVPASVTTF